MAVNGAMGQGGEQRSVNIIALLSGSALSKIPLTESEAYRSLRGFHQDSPQHKYLSARKHPQALGT